MKAIRIHRHGGPEVLQIDEIAVPHPDTGQVLVKIHATAMNHMDLWVRQGIPGVKIPLPIILGCEASGVIEKTGEEVVINPLVSCGKCRFCKEDKDHCCASFGLLGETEDGLDVEFKTIAAAKLVVKPKPVSFEEAAAVPVTFMTAWEMLVGKCKIKKGESVLILAAASGVGSAAVQIAKLHGAFVIATASSDEKLEQAKKLGADQLINHKTQEIAKEVKRITEGRGVDVVFEHVGAATWEQSLRSLARGGKIVTCGATTGAEVKIFLNHLFIKQQQILGSTMGPSSSLPKILDLVAQKKLHPVIDKVFSFSEVKQAHERLEGREQFGKIVLVP